MIKYGWYDVSWARKGNLITKLIGQYESVEQCFKDGADIVYTPVVNERYECVRWLLDLADRYKSKIIFEDIPLAEVQKVKDHPAFMAHAMFDDANDRKQKTLEQVQSGLKTNKQTPRFISMMMQYATTNDGDYFNNVEYIGVQTYTFPYEDTMVCYDMVKKGVTLAAQAPVKPQILATIQVHDIGGGRPSAEYVKAQVWASVMAGAEIVLAYTKVDVGGEVPLELYDVFNSACEEVQALGIYKPTTTVEGENLVARQGNFSVTLNTVTNELTINKRAVN